MDLLEADDPAGLASAPARTVLPGDASVGVKDPVLLYHGDRWHLWASCHPLDREDHADRMDTRYATSPDGVQWTWVGPVLAGRPGRWDARGTRLTSVLATAGGLLASYDGRASAAENFEERTGTARGRLLPTGLFGPLVADDVAPVGSGHGAGGLRYLTVLPLPDRRFRLYTRRPGPTVRMTCVPRWLTARIPRSAPGSDGVYPDGATVALRLDGRAGHQTDKAPATYPASTDDHSAWPHQRQALALV